MRSAMTDGLLGQLVTPACGTAPLPGVPWALDNGCFSDAWSETKWLATLERFKGHPDCLFAVVPDVVGDWKATNKLWAKWHGAVKNRGYKAAYVAQNGCYHIPTSADVLFIGGDTLWKLGAQARGLVAEAKRRGMHVHMGRVNSLRRLRYAADIGCDSADGTYLAFGPDKNLPQLISWLHPAQPSMFGGVA